MKKYKKVIILVISIILVLIIVLVVAILSLKKEDKKEDSDAIKFKTEYSVYGVKIKESNSFKYKTAEEIIDILEKGSAIIFLGNKSNKLSVSIANILQYVNTKEIYYLEIRENEDYSKLIERLNVDKISIPSVYAVKAGNIIQSFVNDGSIDEITKEKQDELKLLFDEMNINVNEDTCNIDVKGGC